MTGINGSDLREWRRSRGWDVPELARQLRRAASEPVAAHDALLRMIRAWERGDHCPSERYELLYRNLGLIPPSDNDQPEALPGPHNQSGGQRFGEKAHLRRADRYLRGRRAPPRPGRHAPAARHRTTRARPYRPYDRRRTRTVPGTAQHRHADPQRRPRQHYQRAATPS